MFVNTRLINVLLYSSSNIRFEILCDFEDQSQLIMSSCYRSLNDRLSIEK